MLIYIRVTFHWDQVAAKKFIITASLHAHLNAEKKYPDILNKLCPLKTSSGIATRLIFISTFQNDDDVNKFRNKLFNLELTTARLRLLAD